jgi:mono/diheme cytochrome c family protein
MNTLPMRQLFFFVTLFGVLGCSDSHDHKANISGKALYEIHCASCHKVTGKGKFLKGIPPNRNTHLSVNELVEKIINSGSSESKMKVFNSMPKKEAKVIALYLKTTLKMQ